MRRDAVAALGATLLVGMSISATIPSAAAQAEPGRYAEDREHTCVGGPVGRAGQPHRCADGRFPAGKGDSGGPVYSVDTNTLKLRVHGIVVKGEGTGSPCTVLSDPARPRLCWHVIYVTDIVPILKYWGLALNRG